MYIEALIASFSTKNQGVVESLSLSDALSDCEAPPPAAGLVHLKHLRRSPQVCTPALEFKCRSLLLAVLQGQPRRISGFARGALHVMLNPISPKPESSENASGCRLRILREAGAEPVTPSAT